MSSELSVKEYDKLAKIVDLHMTRMYEDLAIRFELPEEASETEPPTVQPAIMNPAKEWIERYRADKTARGSTKLPKFVIAKYDSDGFESYSEEIHSPSAIGALGQLYRQVLDDRETEFTGFRVMPVTQDGTVIVERENQERSEVELPDWLVSMYPDQANPKEPIMPTHQPFTVVFFDKDENEIHQESGLFAHNALIAVHTAALQLEARRHNDVSYVYCVTDSNEHSFAEALAGKSRLDPDPEEPSQTWVWEIHTDEPKPVVIVSVAVDRVTAVVQACHRATEMYRLAKIKAESLVQVLATITADDTGMQLGDGSLGFA